MQLNDFRRARDYYGRAIAEHRKHNLVSALLGMSTGEVREWMAVGELEGVRPAAGWP